MSRGPVALLACLLLAGCGTAPLQPAGSPAGPEAEAPAPATSAPTARTPVIGEFGLDLAGKDPSVRPGDDFYRYAGGNWLRTTEFPSDRVRFGTFDVLDAAAERDVHAILEQLAAAPQAPGSARQKAADFYAAFMDTDTLERRGLAPAKPRLELIAAARTHADVAGLLARPEFGSMTPFGSADAGLAAPIEIGITIDAKNPDRYVATIGHGALGLPDREYYLRDDEQFATIRAKYLEHLTRTFRLLGDPAPERQAKAVLALETAIAKLHWPRAKRRERELTYNLRTRAELDALAPGYPWAAALEASGLDGQREFVVRELDAMQPLAALFAKTPVATWRAYMTYHYLRPRASVLPKALDDEFFEFHGRILAGQPEQRVRWKRAVSSTNAAVGEAVGEAYVARHFPPESKAKMLALVANVKRAYAERIDALPWMSAETKTVAKQKLATFRTKIGYPDRWRDYSALDVRRDDALGNQHRAVAFDWQRQVDRLGRRTDRDEWFMSPQTINAYYNPVFNEIVFPAAILQPPFFDPAADAAVNYGSIGGVIGHEMGHGFDDQGAKSDPNGVLRTWWNERDVAEFRKLGDRLAAQYSAFEPLPGLRLDGRLGLGENIGDLGGLSVAHRAYRLSLDGQPAPVLEGLTGDQRFFLGWAQVWRVMYRDQALRNQVMTGPHSPGEFRVNGVVRNVDAWYEAFGVQPGDRLYLPPEQRVHIW
jgi:putative endopeptidase